MLSRNPRLAGIPPPKTLDLGITDAGTNNTSRPFQIHTEKPKSNNLHSQKPQTTTLPNDSQEKRRNQTTTDCRSVGRPPTITRSVLRHQSSLQIKQASMAKILIFGRGIKVRKKEDRREEVYPANEEKRNHDEDTKKKERRKIIASRVDENGGKDENTTKNRKSRANRKQYNLDLNIKGFGDRSAVGVRWCPPLTLLVASFWYGPFLLLLSPTLFPSQEVCSSENMPKYWLTVSLNPEPTTLYSTLLTRNSRSGSPLFFEKLSFMDTMDLITDPFSKTKGKAPPTNENRNIEKDKEPRFPIDLATMHNTKRKSRKRSRTRVGAEPCLSTDLRLDDASPNSRCFPSSRHPYCSDPFTLLYKIDLVCLSEQINQSVDLAKDLYLNDINRNNHTNQSYSFDFMKLLVDFNLIMMRMTSLPINVSRIISKFCLVFSPSVKGLLKLDMRFVKGEAPSDLEINYEHVRTSIGFCDPSLLNFTCNWGSLSVLVKAAFAPNDHGANSYESSENPNRSEMGIDYKPNPLTMYLNPKGTYYLCRSLRLIFKNHFRYDSPAPALTAWMYWLLWFSCFSRRKGIIELDAHPFNDSIGNEQNIYDYIAKNKSTKIHSVEDNCSWESLIVIRSQEEDDLSLEGLKILILYYPRKVSALSIEVRIHEKMKNLTCFWYLITIETISMCSSLNAFLINSKIIIDPSPIFIFLISAPLIGPHDGLLLPFYAINQTIALLVLAFFREMTERKTCTYRLNYYVVISTPRDFFHAPKIDHLECLTIDFPFDFDNTVHRNFVNDETVCFSTYFSLSDCVLLTLCASVFQADLVEEPEKEKMQKIRMKTKSKESITRNNEEHTVRMSPTSQALVTKVEDTIKSIQKNKRRKKNTTPLIT